MTGDRVAGIRTHFTYDLADRLVMQKEYDGVANANAPLRSSIKYTYDDKTNNLIGINHSSPLGEQNISYVRGSLSNGTMPDAVYKIKWNGETRIDRRYDSLGRMTSNSFCTSSGRELYNLIE